MQIYFLSIVLNILAGLNLCSEYLIEKNPGFAKIAELIGGPKSKFVLGAGAFIVGVIKLIFPYSGVFFIGDLIPALGGMGLGFALTMDFLKQRSVINTNTLVRLDKLVIQNKSLIGGLGLIISVIHFFVAGWVIL